MKTICLNSFTGHIKKVMYVFHSNGNSFDIIFIIVIQPEIRKSNGLLRICFYRFYFNLFFTSKYFLRVHNSKKHFFLSEAVVNIFSGAAACSLKNIEIFLGAATQTQKISAVHFLSEAVVHCYLSEAVARSLRNIEVHLGAATHFLKHKKYI